MAAMVVSPGMMRLTLAPEKSRSVPLREGSGGLEPQRTAVGRPGAAPEADALREAVRPAVAGDAPGERRGEAAEQPLDAARAAAVAEQARLAALAASCLRGDAQAWELLVRSQQRRVYALCYRFTGSASEAEDLTQETFLKLYRNLHSFEPARASFGVWLTAMTRNLLVDHYRRSRMQRASESLDEPLPGTEDGPTRLERLEDPRPGQERHVAGLELRAAVQAALTQVSPELREAVILRDLEDLDYREIAAILCIPQGTVKSRISRGRAELARLLKGMEGQVM